MIGYNLHRYKYTKRNLEQENVREDIYWRKVEDGGYRGRYERAYRVDEETIKDKEE